MTIHTKELRGLTVAKFSELRGRFDFDPPYQRQGSIWEKATQQLFIDSIINGYLIPRVYIEQRSTITFEPLSTDNVSKPWAVLDGKQRLQSILDFMDNNFKLSEDFIFLEDLSRSTETQDQESQHEELPILNYTLEELANIRADIASKFKSFEIPIVIVTTTSNDEVEEMFERLNSSSSLNAAERRNAIGCSLRDYTNKLSNHQFFNENCPIKNSRYKYRELASKLIVIELQKQISNKVSDLKANTLMKAFQLSKKEAPGYTSVEIEEAFQRASATLDTMMRIFNTNDKLLKSVGSLTVYYLCFRDAASPYSRQRLQDFEDLRRQQAEEDKRSAVASSSAEAQQLRAYNAWVQSSNDGGALEGRTKILRAFLTDPKGDWPTAAAGTEYLGYTDEDVNPEHD
jgi:hypothetical protein